METKFQASFIPKQPVTEEAHHHTSAASLFFLVSFILFLASLASAAAVFIYGQVITRNINEGQKQLTLNKNAFDPNTIQEITRLNDRIFAADILLKQHKSVSTLFQVLSNTTLKTVKFSEFTYNAADDKITLTMRGQAFNYETVALQAKAFTDPNLKNVFRSPIFSDLNLDAQGNVLFGFITSVDSFLVDYYKLKKEEYGAFGNPSTLPAAGTGTTGADSAPATGGAAPQGFIQTGTSSNQVRGQTIETDGVLEIDDQPLINQN